MGRGRGEVGRERDGEGEKLKVVDQSCMYANLTY